MARQSFKRALCTLPLLLPGALSHMQMEVPSPLRDPHSDRAAEPKDYNILTPLLADGSDFACKLYQYNTPLTSVATYEAGKTYTLRLKGGATHGGGSCQVSLSCDYERFKVIKSMEGDCPLRKEYEFTIPEEVVGAEKCLLAWTWFNKVGNREMYMNCAVVDLVAASSTSRKVAAGAKKTKKQLSSMAKAQAALARYPDLFVANLKGVNDCTTKETVDVVFDDPGKDVVYGDGVRASSRVRRRSKGSCTGVGRTSARADSNALPTSSGAGSSSGSSTGGDDGQYHPEGDTIGSSSSGGETGSDDGLHSSLQDSSSTDGSQSSPSSSDSETSSPSNNGPDPMVQKEIEAYFSPFDDNSPGSSKVQGNKGSGSGEFFEYGTDRGSDSRLRIQLSSRAPGNDDEPTAVPDSVEETDGEWISQGDGTTETSQLNYEDIFPSSLGEEKASDSLPAYLEELYSEYEFGDLDDALPEPQADDAIYNRLKKPKKKKKSNHLSSSSPFQLSSKTKDHDDYRHRSSSIPAGLSSSTFAPTSPTSPTSPSPSLLTTPTTESDTLAFSTSAIPINSTTISLIHSPLPSPSSPSTDSSCTPGSFLCASPTQFWVCGQFGGFPEWTYGALRDVAPGMTCVDGVISGRRVRRGFGWWIGADTPSPSQGSDTSPLDPIIAALDKLIVGVKKLRDQKEDKRDGGWSPELKARRLGWWISASSLSSNVPTNPLDTIAEKLMSLNAILDQTIAARAGDKDKRSSGWWLSFGGENSNADETDPLRPIRQAVEELSLKFDKLSEACGGSGKGKKRRGWGFFGQYGRDNLNVEVPKGELADPFKPILQTLEQHVEVIKTLLPGGDSDSVDDAKGHGYGHAHGSRKFPWDKPDQPWDKRQIEDAGALRDIFAPDEDTVEFDSETLPAAEETFDEILTDDLTPARGVLDEELGSMSHINDTDGVGGTEVDAEEMLGAVIDGTEDDAGALEASVLNSLDEGGDGTEEDAETLFGAAVIVDPAVESDAPRDTAVEYASLLDIATESDVAFGAAMLDATQVDAADINTDSTVQDTVSTDGTVPRNSDIISQVEDDAAIDTLDVFANFPPKKRYVYKRQYDDYGDNVQVPDFWYSDGSDGGNGIEGVGDAVRELFGEERNEVLDGLVDPNAEGEYAESEEATKDTETEETEKDEATATTTATEEDGEAEEIEAGGKENPTQPEESDDTEEYEGWVEEIKEIDDEEEEDEYEEVPSNSTIPRKIRKRDDLLPPGFSFSDGSNGGDGVDADPLAVFGFEEPGNYSQEWGVVEQRNQEQEPPLDEEQPLEQIPGQPPQDQPTRDQARAPPPPKRENPTDGLTPERKPPFGQGESPMDILPINNETPEPEAPVVDSVAQEEPPFGQDVPIEDPITVEDDILVDPVPSDQLLPPDPPGFVFSDGNDDDVEEVDSVSDHTEEDHPTLHDVLSDDYSEDDLIEEATLLGIVTPKTTSIVAFNTSAALLDTIPPSSVAVELHELPSSSLVYELYDMPTPSSAMEESYDLPTSLPAPEEIYNLLPTPLSASWKDGILHASLSTTPSRNSAAIIAASILPYLYGPGPVIPSVSIEWPGLQKHSKATSTSPSTFKSAATKHGVPLQTYAAAAVPLPGVIDGVWPAPLPVVTNRAIVEQYKERDVRFAVAERDRKGGVPSAV